MGEVMRFGTAVAVACVASSLTSVSLSAQWPPHPQAGAPRAADGSVRLDAPAPRTPDGKPDLSGIWETLRTGPGQAITGPDVHPLKRTSQFWNIGAGLEGDLPLQPWALELRAKRVANDSKDNPDPHCLPIGITQLHNHPQPRKIIQTPSVIVILYEANGGIRQIFTDGRPLPGNDPQPWWYGYSIGKWEGDTLVVETTNFTKAAAYRGADPATFRVVERFKRVAADTIQWTATMEDPATWTRPWTIAMPLVLDKQSPILPFECHEHNYGMVNILKAARAAEKR